MSRRLLLLLPVLLVASLVLLRDPPPAAPQVVDPDQRKVARATATQPAVLVVGIPGLRWTDVDDRRTPTLALLQGRGASGVLSVKTAAARDCPADGWLTLGAGNRVVAAGPSPKRCGADLPPPTSLPEQVRHNADRREGAEPGLLADEVRAAGDCVGADGAGARLAAADRTGDDGMPGENPPDTIRTLEAPLQLPATARLCGVLIVEGRPIGGGPTSRTSDLAAADSLVRNVDQVRPAGSTLLVVGVAEPPGARRPHLHVALAIGPTFPTGALTSPSTRREPYVQLVDVAPTILSLLEIETPNEMIGEPWRSVGAVPSLAELRDEGAKADAQRDVTVPFFLVLLGTQALLLGLALWRRWWRTTELVALAGTCAVGASYLANTVPWWQAGTPLVALLAAVAVATAGLTALCLLGRGLLARAGIACGLVALVLVGDLLTGAHLQMSSVAGYSPLVAGRFAGIGNVAFGVLAAAVLLAAASTRSATVAALTALVVIVDGAPQWGSDVGGVLALVPAYAVLVLLLAGRAASLGRIALAAAAGAAVVVAFAIADHARPADEQTHLGRFVGQILDGTAGGVLRRKAEANLGLLFHSPVTALLPVAAAVVVLMFLRPPAPLARTFERSPAWRAGLLAVLTASGLGFLLNDSGAAVPALAIVVAVPATVAVLARHAREPAAPG